MEADAPLEALTNTDEGLKPTTSPDAGTVLAVSEAVSLNPELVRVRVAVAVPAELNEILAGVRLIVNEMTVTGTITEWVPATVPSVPVIVTE